MHRPSIVIMTSRCPTPLDKGDKVRIYHQLKVLKEDFYIHLICLSEQAEIDLSRVVEVTDEVHVFHLPQSRSKRLSLSGIMSRMPMQVAYFYDRHIASRINHLLWQIAPVYIHCHLIRMAPYCLHYTSSPKSIDYMDSMVLNDLAGQYLNHGLKTMLKAQERRKVKAYESDLAAYFDAHYVISERDRQCFSEELQSQLTLLHNGVDSNFFDRDEGPSPVYDLVFCGNLGYSPNVLAANYLITEILPLVSDSKLLLAGADMDHRIDYSSDRVHSVGRVADIRDAYRKGSVLVAPIFTGAGQQNKILEAMALGVPCVTTSFVNQSLKAVEGTEIMIADTPAAFARCINDLLSHPQLKEDMSIMARNFVQRNFDWRVNTAPLVNTIHKTLGSNE